MADEEQRKNLYDQTREELLSKQLSNSQTYDNAILTLSSAFLALSIAFVKDILGEQQPHWPSVLYLSWGLFCGAIVATIGSFMYGQQTIKKLMDKAQEYYLEGKEEARQYSRHVSVGLDCINGISGTLFILAVLSTLIFAIVNFSRPASMPNETKTTTTEILKKSQPTNTFQQVKPTQAPATGGTGGAGSTSGQTQGSGTTKPGK